MSALVSVVIAVYNCEKYILEAIQSVLSQTYSNIELVIVNDGSTDATADLVCRHYPGIRHVLLPRQGQFSSINHGIGYARGEYISFLDADDLFVRDKIALQVDKLQSNPEIDMVFGGIEEFITPEQSDALRPYSPRQAFTTHVTAGGLFRISCFERAGLFDPKWEVGGFIDWYMRAQEAGLKECLIPELTIRRRIHGRNKGFYLRDRQGDYLKIVKSALDRRKAAKSL